MQTSGALQRCPVSMQISIFTFSVDSRLCKSDEPFVVLNLHRTKSYHVSSENKEESSNDNLTSYLYTMEAQRFYETDNNNLFYVRFANWQELTNEKISRIFANFGEVHSVRSSGDERGFRFVRYTREEDVVRCVEGLRNNPTIRLKVKNPNFIKKKDQETEKGSGYRLINNRQSVETPASEDTKNTESIQSLNINGPSADTNNSSEQKNNEQHVATGTINETVKSEPPKTIHIAPEPPKTMHIAPETPKTPEDSKTTPKVSRSYNDPLYFEPPKMLRKPEVAAESYMPAYKKTPNEKTLSTNPTSPKIAVPPLIEPDGMPRLVTKSPGRAAVEVPCSPKDLQASPAVGIRTLTAEEIVVANIHSDFSIHYILHLMQKHDPLSISGMKIIQSLGLRYCIVYLKSLQQAYAVEKEFDKFMLSGKDLIVMRCQRLAEMVGKVQ